MANYIYELKLRATDWIPGVQFSERKEMSVFHHVHTSSGINSSSYPMGTRSPLFGV